LLLKPHAMKSRMKGRKGYMVEECRYEEGLR